MSIPLDRVYTYIDRLITDIRDDVIIYRFNPHGSKNLKDLMPYKSYTPYTNMVFGPKFYCHDQEPLNWNLYVNGIDIYEDPVFSTLKKSLKIETKRLFSNLRFMPADINDFALLLHSEKNSVEVKRYQDADFIPVYYWSHAVIAQDWFRFARHIKQLKQTQKHFLIYNRAWSGSREYRLKFADLLIQNNIWEQCHTRINCIDPDLQIHYKDFCFGNNAWKPQNQLEDYFDSNQSPSHFSADFDIADYESTDIEVVLETLFDDQRLHLTEKSLRPIACGQPFILAATAGSLNYLRNYGFKTFDSVWDEQYDLIDDPVQRLQAIVDLMKQIVSWSPEQRKQKMQQAYNIAEYNKQYFFSDEFFNKIITELKYNLNQGFAQFEKINTYNAYYDHWKTMLNCTTIANYLKTNPGPEAVNFDFVSAALSHIDQLKINKYHVSK